MLLYRYVEGHNTTNTIQVKMSRTYYKEKRRKGFTYNLWFNRFDIQENANWYILVGIYARFSQNANARAKSTIWDTIMLAFTNKEMQTFMDNVKQKKDPTKDDKMFGFGFDDDKIIYLTRGCPQPIDMSSYLIKNRLNAIRNSFV